MRGILATPAYVPYIGYTWIPDTDVSSDLRQNGFFLERQTTGPKKCEKRGFTKVPSLNLYLHRTQQFLNSPALRTLMYVVLNMILYACLIVDTVYGHFKSCSVSDPDPDLDPDWILIQSGPWIRMRYLFRAEGFSCSLDNL
jgi:hypothetical protein